MHASAFATDLIPLAPYPSCQRSSSHRLKCPYVFLEAYCGISVSYTR